MHTWMNVDTRYDSDRQLDTGIEIYRQRAIYRLLQLYTDTDTSRQVKLAIDGLEQLRTA